MPTKKIRGIHLSYDDLGPRQGQPIVFIHGHAFNRSMWDEQVAYFKDQYRLILPDLRGYGETEVTGPKILLDEMALDIAHLLEELGIERAVFCGLSMGGQILLDFYRLFPQKVRAIIIADSDARGETPESRANRLAMAEDILAHGMVRHTEETIHKYIAASSMKNSKIYDHLYKMMVNTAPEGAAAAHRGRAERRDHTGILASIGVPAMVIVGSEDFFTPPPIAAIMGDRIPGCRLVCIEGAGHVSNMEFPEVFNETLDSFLKQLTND